MKAFITGATGFLGTHLAQQLHDAGWDIVALHRSTSNVTELKKLKNIELVCGDITDIESLRRAIPEGVDAVYHTAASVEILPHKDEHTRYGINQLGTRNVVEVCKEKKVGRVLYTTTVLTYDFRVKRNFNEEVPPNDWCRDPYIHSKRLADIEMEKGLKNGLDVVFLHPSAMFGSYDKATWSKLFLEIERGLPLPFAPPAGGSICHAEKIAEAHVAAFEKGGKGKHYILGGPDELWIDVMRKIAKILGRPAPKMRLPVFLFKMYGWSEFFLSSLIKREPALTPHTIDILSEHIYMDSSLAEKELGYKSSTTEEMLLDCYHWMVDVGMLSPRKAAMSQKREAVLNN